jgi:hypothetical protein
VAERAVHRPPRPRRLLRGERGSPYDQLTCDQRPGAWGQNGVHFFFTNDTDNGFGPKPATEVDAQQWVFPVSTATPHAVGEPYAEAIRPPSW